MKNILFFLLICTSLYSSENLEHYRQVIDIKNPKLITTFQMILNRNFRPEHRFSCNIHIFEGDQISTGLQNYFILSSSMENKILEYFKHFQINFDRKEASASSVVAGNNRPVYQLLVIAIESFLKERNITSLVIDDIRTDEMVKFFQENGYGIGGIRGTKKLN